MHVNLRCAHEDEFGYFHAACVRKLAAARMTPSHMLASRVLLLDLGLPDMSGLEVAREIRRRPAGGAADAG